MYGECGKYILVHIQVHLLWFFGVSRKSSLMEPMILTILILRSVLMIISFVAGGWAESGAAILQPEVFCGTQSRLGPLQHQAWSQGIEFNV